MRNKFLGVDTARKYWPRNSHIVVYKSATDKPSKGLKWTANKCKANKVIGHLNDVPNGNRIMLFSFDNKINENTFKTVVEQNVVEIADDIIEKNTIDKIIFSMLGLLIVGAIVIGLIV